jgi:hypothetical protein
MKAIIRQAGILIMFLAAFYLGLFFLSFLFYPAGYKGPIDTSEASKTVFLTAPRLLAMNITQLSASGKKKLIFLGSSNVEEGFRPSEIKMFCPEYEIHNLAIGASNITQLRQVADLLFSAPPAGSLDGSVFVLGIWYGSFVHDAARWKKGVTSLERELFRYRTYRMHNGKPVPTFGWKALPYWNLALRPVFFISGIIENLENEAFPKMKRFAAVCIHERQVDFGILYGKNTRDAVAEKDKKYALSYWRDYMNTPDECLVDEQFKELLALCEVLEKKKVRVILVDMPLPQWHSERSPYFRCYQRKKTEFLGKVLASMAVTYIDLQDMGLDSDFYDSTHPVPEVTRYWSYRLVSTLHNTSAGSKTEHSTCPGIQNSSK